MIVAAHALAAVGGFEDEEAFRLKGEAEDSTDVGRVVDEEDGHLHPDSAAAFHSYSLVFTQQNDASQKSHHL